MSNLPFPIQPATYERLGGSTQTGLTIGQGTGGVYGGWVSLSGAFSSDVQAITLYLRNNATSGERALVCLAAGAGSDNNIFAKDIWLPKGYYEDTAAVYLPVSVPAGQTIFAKAAGISGTGPQVAIVGVSSVLSVPLGHAKVESLKIDLANTYPFTHASTQNADTWIEVVASTSNAYRAICLDQSTQDTQLDSYLTRIGIGAPGQEVSIAGDFLTSKNNPWPFGSHGWRPCYIPAGARVVLSCRTGGGVRTDIRTQILGLVA